MCAPGFTGRGQVRQQKAAKYPDIRLTYSFAFESSSLPFQSTRTPLKVNGNLAPEELLYSGGMLNFKDRVVERGLFPQCSISVLPLQCVATGSRGCSSCASSPKHTQSPLSLLYSGDQFTEQRYQMGRCCIVTKSIFLNC